MKLRKYIIYLYILTHFNTYSLYRTQKFIKTTSKENFGKKAFSEQFPFLTAIFLNEKFLCSGSLVRADCIITSADCVSDENDEFTKWFPKQTNKLSIKLGTTILNDSCDDGVCIKLNVKDVLIHADYDVNNDFNDIAALILEKRVTDIRIADLAIKSPDPGKICNTAIWTLESNSDTNLRQIDVPIIDYTTCNINIRETFKESNKRKSFLTSGIVCTLDGSRSTCTKDLGGPLVCDGYLTGITSWADGCDVDVPIIFTEISKYRSWINESCVHKQAPPKSTTGVYEKFRKKNTIFKSDSKWHKYSEFTVLIVLLINYYLTD